MVQVICTQTVEASLRWLFEQSNKLDHRFDFNGLAYWQDSETIRLFSVFPPDVLSHNPYRYDAIPEDIPDNNFLVIQGTTEQLDASLVEKNCEQRLSACSRECKDFAADMLFCLVASDGPKFHLKKLNQDFYPALPLVVEPQRYIAENSDSQAPQIVLSRSTYQKIRTLGGSAFTADEIQRFSGHIAWERSDRIRVIDILIIDEQILEGKAPQIARNSGPRIIFWGQTSLNRVKNDVPFDRMEKAELRETFPDSAILFCLTASDQVTFQLHTVDNHWFSDLSYTVQND